MRRWESTTVDGVRLGNIVSYNGVTDEVTGKRPSSMGGNTSTFLDLRDNDSLELYRDTTIDVYR